MPNLLDRPSVALIDCCQSERELDRAGTAVHLAMLVGIMGLVPGRVLLAQGPYSEPQADRGASVYRAQCQACHGPDLDAAGVPPLSGPAFATSWGREDRTLRDLFQVLSTTMPPGRAPDLDDASHLAVLTYILRRNGVPAGPLPLTRERLTGLRFDPPARAVGADRSPPPDFLAGPRGLEPTASGPTHAELMGAGDNADDWLFHTHDYTGRRYSALAQVTRDNVRGLRAVCAYQLGDLGNFQTGPIVYRGVMYLTTTHLTVALDAATCRPRWKHVWEVQDRDVWPNNRGVALKDGRVVRATSDGYLIALDAADGTLLWARHVGFADKGETFTMAPLVWDDLVIIGPAGSENAIRGWVGAFALRDGTPVWRFNIVPEPGEPGSETWTYPPDLPIGGGATWTPFALDTDRGLVHVAATNPAPDFPAALRRGDNLYTNSMLALDARTGTLAWYAQLVPADDHDWDLTQVSPLFSAVVNGRRRDLIATVGKDGILRVLDRETHERLYATPVTTIRNAEAPVTTAGTHACPGILGGVEWNGPAYHPGTGMLYTPAVDWCGTFTLADTVRYVQGKNYLGGVYRADSTSQGWVTAVDASTGEVRWRYRSPRPMVGAVTATAGGLVFTGELTGDFIALDAQSGDVRYRFNTGGPIGGGVVSYAVGGKQYVAVMSGKPSGFWVDQHAGSATVLVLALPDADR